MYLSDSKEEVADEMADEQPWTLRDVLHNMNERNKSLPSAVGSFPVAHRSELDGRPDSSLDGFRRLREAPNEIIDAGAPVPESPRTGVDSQELPPLFPPNESEPPSPSAESDTTASSEFQPPEEFEEYTVKFGDTLSGIAQKTLGSPNRYQEIYDANRDRMASPDRLDIGKSLRIPRIVGVPSGT